MKVLNIITLNTLLIFIMLSMTFAQDGESHQTLYNLCLSKVNEIKADSNLLSSEIEKEALRFTLKSPVDPFGDLHRMLKSSNLSMRLLAIRILGKLCDDRAIPMLETCFLEDLNEQIRIESLGLLSQRLNFQNVRRLEKEKELSARCLAMLRSFSNTESVIRTISFFSDCTTAQNVLLEILEMKLKPEWFKDGDYRSRKLYIQCAEALVRMQDIRLIAILGETYGGRKHPIASLKYRFISKLKHTDAIRSLVFEGLAIDQESGVKRSAVIGLNNLEYQTFINYHKDIMRVLEDNSPSVRFVAYRTIVELVDSKFDPPAKVHRACSDAIKRSKDKYGKGSFSEGAGSDRI